MIDGQASLLDGLVRATDPATSHAAAASIRPHLSAQCSRVLHAVERVHSMHGHGATAWEVTAYLGGAAQRSVIARRLTDLRDAGRIRATEQTRPGPTGRPQLVWEPTPN